jgi:hypothetical protein
MLATVGLSAITLWGAGGHDAEPASPKPSHVSSIHMDGKPNEVQPPSAPVPAPVPATAAETESASSAFARVEAARVEAAGAGPGAQQPSAAARPAREREARTARDTRDGKAEASASTDKHAKKAAAAPSGRRPALAVDDFEADDSEGPRLTVAPASGEIARTKAPAADLASKPLAATADAAPVQEVAKSVPAEPEIPVGLVELPNRGRVVVAPEPTKPVAGPASLAPGANDHASYDHAQVQFGTITTQAAVSKASIRNALNESAMRRCYTDALRLGAAGGAPMSAQLELTTNMGGRIASASVSGGLPKQLASCVEQVAKSGRVREVDTGTARATVMISFQP